MEMRAIAFGILGFVVGIAVVLAWPSNGSYLYYEECMLDKLRNQHDPALFNVAKALCDHLPRKAK